jgi:hypothetical protein
VGPGYESRRVFGVRRVDAFVDETYLQVGSFEAWVWVAVEPVHKPILSVYLSRPQNILVAQLFLRTLVELRPDAVANLKKWARMSFLVVDRLLSKRQCLVPCSLAP